MEDKGRFDAIFGDFTSLFFPIFFSFARLLEILLLGYAVRFEILLEIELDHTQLVGDESFGRGDGAGYNQRGYECVFVLLVGLMFILGLEVSFDVGLDVLNGPALAASSSLISGAVIALTCLSKTSNTTFLPASCSA